MYLEETVWRMIRISGSERGVMKLTKDRFSFAGDKGTRFDVPISSITEIKFPWHYFGGGMKVSIGADNYRFSFIEPHNEYASISDARETGSKWKAALASVTGKDL